MSWRVVPVEAEDIVALRQVVLRPGQPRAASEYPEDAVARHFGAVFDGRVVGCATFFPADYPGPDVPAQLQGLAAWRLRGMATDESVRSAGVGSAVLREGLAAVAAVGAELVWCNARSTAVGFYQRHGFVREGEEFLFGGAVPLPHYRAWVRLPG